MPEPSAATLTEESEETSSTTAREHQEVRTGRSPGQVAWARLKRDKVAIICFAIILFFLLVAIFAPFLVSLEAVDPITGAKADPSTVHTELVDFNGLPTVVGVALGLVGGYLGGASDKVISWVIDFFLSLPILLLVLAIIPIMQKRIAAGSDLTPEETSAIRFWVLIVILVVFGWMGLARLVRGEVKSLREREFVQAARAVGVPTRSILFREVLPNLVGPIIVSMSIAVPAYIAFEATLSFLGAGLVEPTASWGRTIANAQNSFASYPLYLWPPVIGVSLLVLALSLLGDSIRDAFDPTSRR